MLALPESCVGDLPRRQLSLGTRLVDSTHPFVRRIPDATRPLDDQLLTFANTGAALTFRSYGGQPQSLHIVRQEFVQLLCADAHADLHECFERLGQAVGHAVGHVVWQDVVRRHFHLDGHAISPPEDVREQRFTGIGLLVLASGPELCNELHHLCLSLPNGAVSRLKLGLRNLIETNTGQIPRLLQPCRPLSLKALLLQEALWRGKYHR
mmetsp:Transcript_154924/g.495396  ORF Transcript_154924/g.495396 Transcript_154924/m.495396 type:complete len:209 (-) Transcript_154924:847-1473(-)